MPTTVTASNSVAYHLWQLPDLTVPEPEDEFTFATIDNPLTDGYRAGILCGFNAGTRRWRFTCPTLAGLAVSMPTVTDINGATVSRESYVRSLWAENQVTGIPFVIQDSETSVYYFVDIVDPFLSMKRASRVKLFSTGLQLKQRRLAGVTLP